MLLQKRNRYKPLYKQFIKLRENIQNRKKLFNFNKKKWHSFQKINSKKVKPKDQVQYLASRYPNRISSYMKKYKNTLIINKKFKLFYGGLLQKVIKKRLRVLFKKNYKNLMLQFLMFFEYRLDVVLYKCYFTTSIREAKQLISHNKVFVNHELTTLSSYLLKPGDLISIKLDSFNNIKQNIKKSYNQFVFPKHLFINYNILQIIFGSFKNVNFSLNFSYYLNLEKIIASSYHN